MQNHRLVKTGLGAGLMAVSVSAMADIHTFAEPMLYYKLNGAVINYAVFVPSLAMPSAGVVLLDLYQSGTVNSWAYGVGGAVDAGAGGIVWSVKATDSVSYTTVDMLGVSHVTNVASSTINSSWYGGVTAAVSLAFSQQPTISSQACNVSFVASIGADDYLKFTGFTILPSDWPTASNAVSWRTKTGTVEEDTSSVAAGAWNGYNASATTAFATFSAYSIPAAGGSGQTIAASQITKFNLCTNAYTTRNALNSAGNTIGSKSGLMRLW